MAARKRQSLAAASRQHDAFAALGNPLRLRALSFLATRPHGGAYAGDLVTHLRRAQSTVSHHLKVLLESGILTCEQHGTWTWYQLVPGRLAELREHLAAFVPVRPATVGSA